MVLEQFGGRGGGEGNAGSVVTTGGEEGEGRILDRFSEDVAGMEESQREEVMRMYEASMPVEFGQWEIEVGKASLRRMVEKRADGKERKMKSELMKEGVRRMFFHAGSGSNGVFNFRKYEGQTFAAVYMKDRSYVGWALKQDECRS